MRKKIIITGSSGLLGQFLCKNFSAEYDVVGLYHNLKPNPLDIAFEKVDLTSAAEVHKSSLGKPADIVIHTAGMTSVDECEENPDLAHRLNVLTTKNIAEVLKGNKTKLIHLSTDHLFSGKQAFSTEQSPFFPLNVYARTKIEAEQTAMGFKNTVCLRTNFYGGHSEKKKSFSSWIHFELSNERTIRMFDDIFITPISIIGLAANIELIMNSQLKGIYNMVGSERISKYEFGLKLAEVFNLNPEFILKSQSESLKLKAKRPKDMSLSIDKIEKDLAGFVKEDVTRGLMKIKQLGLL